MSLRNKVIAVDFDGTITTNSKYPKTGRIRKRAISVLIKLQNAGYKICLWTCRENEDLEEALSLLKKHNFIPDAVNRDIKSKKIKRKVKADYYIDNKNILFTVNWGRIEKFLIRRKHV